MNIALITAVLVFIAGIGIGLQSPMIGILSSRLGPLESVFVVHIGGAILSGIPLVLMAGGKLGALGSAPWYAWFAGAFGLVTVAAIGFAVPRVGVSGATVALILGQLLTAAVIDHFGWFGVNVRAFDPVRAAGFGLLLAGAWLVIRPT